ncbi:MAG: hypothetical protein V5A39_08905 [Haloarculaceae archaeon]
MSQPSKPQASRIEEYWDWFAVALFLLVTVDLLTTIGATLKYGLGAEINPVIIWLFRQGLLVLVVAHLGVTVLAVSAFAGLIRTIKRVSSPYDIYLEYAAEVWLGLLLLAGFVVFANNLSVIVLGRSLL